MYLFRNQLDFSSDELIPLKNHCELIVLAYVKVQVSCPNATSASHNDLEFLKLMTRESIRKNIQVEDLKKLLNHLWYLSTNNVILAFFDDNAIVEIKLNMVQASLCKDKIEEPSKRVQLPSELIDDSLNLDYFVNKNSRIFFKILNSSTDF